jgi:DinB family protein
VSTATSAKTAISNGLDSRVMARIVEEGYGPGAWHGSDLKAALADVKAPLAFWRPAEGRHNIAEIALHHAFCARSVRGQLSGTTPEPFVMEGEDWFALPDGSRLGWPKIREVVDGEQRLLAAVLADIAAGQVKSPLTDAERFDLVLGITCHAVYHAGQVQLLKRLRGE